MEIRPTIQRLPTRREAHLVERVEHLERNVDDLIRGVDRLTVQLIAVAHDGFERLTTTDTAESFERAGELTNTSMVADLRSRLASVKDKIRIDNAEGRQFDRVSRDLDRQRTELQDRIDAMTP